MLLESLSLIPLIEHKCLVILKVCEWELSF